MERELGTDSRRGARGGSELRREKVLAASK